MHTRKIFCLSCKYNVKNSSCCSCTDKESIILAKLIDNLGIEFTETEEDQIKSIKLSCKILNRYPEDNDKLNPFDCKYYLPVVLRFF